MAAASIDQYLTGQPVTGEAAVSGIAMQPVDDGERAAIFRAIESAARIRSLATECGWDTYTFSGASALNLASLLFLNHSSSLKALLATRLPLLYYVEMPNPVVHFEIGCRDTTRTRKLYQDLFDWKIQGAGPAATIAEAGISGHITALGHEPHNYTIFYVEVADVVAHIAKAESLGCKKIVGPVTIPTGTFAWISDPDGNTIGLWKSAA